VFLSASALLGVRLPQASGRRQRMVNTAAAREARADPRARRGRLDHWTPLQRQVHDWLQFASWGHCGVCGRVYQRKMTEAEVLDPDKTMQLVTAPCSGCSGRQRLPQPVLARTIPAVLRQLSDRQWRTLATLDLSQGEPYQHPQGYKRRDKLSALAWKPKSVTERLADLPAAEAAAARAAYDWLMCAGTGKPWRPWIWSQTKRAVPGAGKASAKVTLQHRGTGSLWMVCGPVIDYSSRYDLLQFQFDRHVMRTVFGSAAAGIDLDNANRHRHWSPTQLPAAEALAIAHAVQQFCAGYLAGFGPHRPWRKNVFSNKQDKNNNVLAYVGRWEFQEGGQEHEYGKGRGSLHCHLLFWLKNFPASMVENYICASLPETDAELRFLALQRQEGVGATASQAVVRDEPTAWRWQPETKRWALLLRHTENFVLRGLRPFLTSVLRILGCHSDIQWWDGQGALLRYCAAYVAKYREAWDALAMSEGGCVAGQALALLRGWRAAEAEMAMVLARQPMVFQNFVGQEYIPPVYGKGEDTALHLYRRRPADLESTTFLEWLRLHTVQGHPADHTARATRRRAGSVVCVGVLYQGMAKDAFYWQWLCMNKPHRRQAPGTWDNDAWVTRHAETEGHKKEWVMSFVARVRACRRLVQEQLARPTAAPAQPCVPRAVEAILTADQHLFLAQIQEEVRARGEARSRADADEHEDVLQALCVGFPYLKAHCLLGGPGSGKTHTVRVLLDHILPEEFSAVYATPTGLLSTSMPRRKKLLCTTYHRAFGIAGSDRLAWGNEALFMYDVWILDEISMIPTQHFEHMMRQWLLAGRWPILIFVGDFGQLPPIGLDTNADARQSPLWRQVARHDLGCRTNFRAQDTRLLNFQELVRSSMPTAQQLELFSEDIFS
ncbi:unnamed protein product, partial [Effrenium voratum]